MRTWRFVTITLVALTLGMLFAHVLELGPKMGYPAPLYVKLNNSLYYWYGTVGAAVEVGALVSVVVLAVLARDRRPALPLTAAAAACQAAALGAFFAVIEPVNVVIRESTPASVPADFSALRAQWEYGHAAHAALFAAAFALLLISVLVETPEPSARWARR